MYRKLLVASDGSEGSQIAVLHASILAKKLGAELTALWVRGSLPHYPETIDEIDEEEESAHEFFENLKVQLQSVAAAQVHVLWIQECAPAHIRSRREPIEDEKRAQEFFQTVLRKRVNVAAVEQGVAVDSTYRCGNAASTLVAEVESGGYRLIVLGHHGQSGLLGNCWEALRIASVIWSAAMSSWFGKR